jgi:prophage antirepressor-like protein
MNESTNKIIPFGYGDSLVRVVEDEKGTPYWVAKDIVRILGLENAGEATKSLEDDEVLNLKQILKNKDCVLSAKKQGLRYDAIKKP